MRKLTTGIDSNGRASIIGSVELGAAGETLSTRDLFKSDGSPPRISRAGRKAAFRDLGLAPGAVRSMIVHWPPAHEAAMHHTDTVDVDVVVSGSIEFVLDGGSFRLEPGDCVVVNGVDHAWKAGPDGC